MEAMETKIEQKSKRQEMFHGLIDCIMEEEAELTEKEVYFLSIIRQKDIDDIPLPDFQRLTGIHRKADAIKARKN